MVESVPILFEDNHLLVLNKPAGLVVQGAVATESSLVDFARQHLKEKYHKPGNVFVGVVSRLDRQVSGLIVMARTSKAAARLTEQFRSGRVIKRYWALVPAEPAIPQHGELTHYLWKDDARHRMVAQTSPGPNAQLAKLSYSIIAKKKDRRLLEITLQTGRKHQIRVQLAALGIPILGDAKYGSLRNFSVGIGLHSRFLEFEHPTLRTRLTFTCPPPEYWSLPAHGIN